MKNIYFLSFRFTILLVVLLASASITAAPPPVPTPVFPLCEDFNNMGQFGTEMNLQGGWTGGVGNFRTYVVHGQGNSVGLSLNINTFATEDNLMLPPVGPVPSGSTVSISYRIVTYSGGLPFAPYTLSPNDSITLNYVSNSAGTEDIIKIMALNHIDTLGFRTITMPLNVPNGDTLFFQLFAVADFNGTDDFWIDIDSVCISHPTVKLSKNSRGFVDYFQVKSLTLMTGLFTFMA